MGTPDRISYKLYDRELLFPVVSDIVQPLYTIFEPLMYHTPTAMERLKQSSLANHVRGIRALPRAVLNWRLFLSCFVFAMCGTPKGVFMSLQLFKR
jgi:hypothetical protein